MILFLSQNEFTNLKILSFTENALKPLIECLEFSEERWIGDVPEHVYYRALNALKYKPNNAVYHRLRELAALQDDGWYQKMEIQHRQDTAF